MERVDVRVSSKDPKRARAVASVVWSTFQTTGQRVVVVYNESDEVEIPDCDLVVFVEASQTTEVEK